MCIIFFLEATSPSQKLIALLPLHRGPKDKASVPSLAPPGTVSALTPTDILPV